MTEEIMHETDFIQLPTHQVQFAIPQQTHPQLYGYLESARRRRLRCNSLQVIVMMIYIAIQVIIIMFLTGAYTQWSFQRGC